MSVFNIEGSGGGIDYASAQVKEDCKDCSLNYYPCNGEKRIKELEDALTFTVKALSNFFPFCGKDANKLPNDLDTTQYLTCSYAGDKALFDRYIECRKLIGKVEVE